MTAERGERAAADAYLSCGYRVLARNWRCKFGELDLVLIRDDTLVICEVKSRRGDAFGAGWQSVTRNKQAKIRALAEVYVSTMSERAIDVRFDVASVRVPGSSGSPEVELFEDAF